MKKITTAFLLSICLLGVSSCKAPKDVAYFQNTENLISIADQQPIKVRPEDKLTIIVKSKDPEVSDLFNLPVYTQRVGATMSGSNGIVLRDYKPTSTDGVAIYTVDKAGYIDFPILGKLKIEGMSRSEVAGFIKGELIGRDLVKDPTVTVEFVNTGVNLIGELKNPGRYDLNKDHISIIDAVSMAGDLTINGRRDNIKVIRKDGDQMRVYEINLTDLKKTAESPAFYLQQDDVVYVEPNDMRKRESTVNGDNVLSTSFWISVASLITTAVTTVGVFVNK